VRPKRFARSLTITGYGLSGIFLLIAVISASYFASGTHSLDEKKATRLIRLYLKYRSSEAYTKLYKNGQVDAQETARYHEEVDKIDRLRFESVIIGRLFPNYLLSDWGPIFYAKAVTCVDDGRMQTRYYNLGSGELVVGESSRLIWLFVF